MKRNRKTAWAWNLLLVLVCIALAVCFGGLLAWDAKAEAVRSEKLMQEAKKDKKQEVKQEVKKDKKKKKLKKRKKSPQNLFYLKGFPSGAMNSLLQKTNCSILQE